MYISNDKSTLSRRYWKNPVTSVVTSVRNALTPVYKALARIEWSDVFYSVLGLLIMFSIASGITYTIVDVVQQENAKPDYELVEIHKVDVDSYFIIVRNTNPNTKEYWPDSDLEEVTLLVIEGDHGRFIAKCLSTEYNYMAIDAAVNFAEDQNRSEKLTRYTNLVETR